MKSSVVSPKQKINKECVYAKGDSAASDHYFREEDEGCLQNVTKVSGNAITIPDGSTIQATKKGYLPLSTELSEKTREAKILPALKSASLISIGKLCDNGCKVQFEKNNMNVIKNDKIIMSGTRNKTDGLYDIPIEK